MSPALCVRAAALVLAGLVATAATAQQNQVTNSSFDEDVLGWTPVEAYMSVVFDPDDVDGDEMSGSALVTFNPSLGVETSGHVTQPCLEEIHPGESYTASASYMIPTGQMRTGSARMRVAWYTSADCSGAVSAFGFGASDNDEGAWFDLFPVAIAAPANALSAKVQLRIEKPQLGGSLAMHFDEVMFVPEPSQGLAAGVALATLAFARRSRRGLA